MNHIALSPQAQTDLTDIWVYIAQQNPDAADRVIDEIWDKAKHLSLFPFTGRSREELSPGLRSFPAGKYIIYYRPTANGITIARVLRGARDPRGLI